MYYDSRPPLPPNFLPQHPFNLGGSMTVRDEALAAWPRTEAVVSDQLAEYYGMVTHLDEQVGRILDALASSGHADDTLVIYAADHGLAVGSHGLLGKQSVYEHSQRSPLIFSAPWIPTGESNAFSYLLDIFPTVAGMTGTTLPDDIDLDGEDLSAIWRGEIASVRDSVFLAYTNESRSVRDDRYKLIRYPRTDHTQLFDLVGDPDELQSLADDPSQAERVEALTALLRQWQERLGDTLPLTAEELIPMDIDLTGRERQPDRWQPDWIVEKYFGSQGGN
jgi:arylsulfatase A-like enzyme